MPKLNRTYTLEITPEQFLNSCSPVELQEISLLLNNNFYQSRLQSRQCWECGCSDYDCSQCIEKTNQTRRVDRSPYIIQIYTSIGFS